MSSFVELEARDGGRFEAYLASPRRSGAPGLVVLQEIFGVNSNMRAVADMFAGAGFTAIVPDLFWRQEPRLELDPESASDRGRAMVLMQGLDEARALDDATVAATYLRTHLGAQRVGCVGYCLGGRIAYLLSTTGAFNASVSYYGVGIQTVLDRAPTLKSRTLLHIASDDQLCPPEAQAKIRTAMAPLGDRVVILDYLGVGHAFARRGGASYAADAAATADQATLAFLRTELENA